MHRLVILAICGALALASCGGDDKTEDPEPTCDRGSWDSNATIHELVTLEETYAGYTHIGGSVRISGEEFTNVDSLLCLEYVGRKLDIISNPVLTDLDGLSNVTEVGGALNVEKNTVLTNIDGLSGITTIGTGLHDEIKYLQIFDNPVLENVDGLSNLTTVAEGLYIYSNPELTNLDGLENLVSLGGDESLIVDNPNLPNCQAEALRDRLQASGYSGTFLLSGNDMTATCD
jgi:hypothetical protein